MTPQRTAHDVVIAGGGLAGLCLALQLRRRVPDIDVLVVEKRRHPPPLAAHKVGESSVEIASHYFRTRLGLDQALAAETSKFGLRFFMSNGDNRDISTRLECGPSHFLTIPAFQIDRGQFEAALADACRAAGVSFVDACRVADIQLDAGAQRHRLRLNGGDTVREVDCRWLIDASGRAGLLKRKLDLAEPNRHDVSAVWFRVDHPLDVDDWCDDPGWSGRVREPRRLSTNHLMGDGYWVWLIPLAGGRTSVGIVAGEAVHPYAQLNTPEKALGWLRRYEPQCAERVAASLERGEGRLDFLGLRNFSYSAKQTFSAERWCLIGEAGMFVDPLYSPGGDFIGIGNELVTELVARELAGEAVGERAAAYDRIYRGLYKVFLSVYRGQYPVMGSGRAMTLKVLWDFVVYWGGVAPLFFAGKLPDLDFMARVRPLLNAYAVLGIRTQRVLRQWAHEDREPAPPAFVDYSEMPVLARLNAELLERQDDDALFARIEANLELASSLQREIFAEAGRRVPRLRRPETPSTDHLAAVLARLA